MNLPLTGHHLLYLALATALLNVGATIWAYRCIPEKRGMFLRIAHRSALSTWVVLHAAAVVLWILFVTDDFSVNYVWAHSSLAQPIAYKISAFWGGQAGSLLMWAGVLATYGLAVAIIGKKQKQIIAPGAVAVICAVNIFFIALMLYQANPFTLTGGELQKDGFGLNPLLQNYWMQIHPPILYSGYVGCTVPFAFAVSALLHRQFDASWVTIVRRWALFNWIVLFVGIVLGGVWAYETLGWGGYWAWDPVENASLMPWLVLTAFIHSVMLQQRRGLLRNWNFVLVSVVFLLSIFGTFLTRSGIVSSVHSFAESDIGEYFLAFLAFASVATVLLIIARRDDLRPDASIESPISREAAFVVSNILLLAATCAILWGTIFPTVREALSGVRVTVEQGFFNKTCAPLGLLILAMAGVGPLLSWRKTSRLQLLRVLRAPLWSAAIGVVVFVAPLLWYLGKWSVGAAIAFLLFAFLVGTIGQEFWRGAIARQRMYRESFVRALGQLLVHNRRRYGGYIVHLGLGLFFIGLTGSSVFKIELEPRDLKVGDTMKIGEYVLKFTGFMRPQEMAPQKKSDVAAQIMVSRGGAPLLDRKGQQIYLTPNIDVYKSISEVDGQPEERGAPSQPEQTARRPAILSSLSNDLYLALIGYDINTGTATIKAYVNPLIIWIWIAVGFFISGTVIAMLPQPKYLRQAAKSEKHALGQGDDSARKPASASVAPDQTLAASHDEA